MGAIQVKNVSENLHEAMRRRADEEGLSLSEYVLSVVRRDLALPSRRAWFARLATREAVDGPPAAETIGAVRADRDDQLDRAGRR